ncbi:MAG: epoxyqueuosine reductase QueH [Peptococcaceae bacterium]|mgnify:FL=1|jgi:predicted adenine nucleotide alpha hydrolase (AANH) superfamily ATPase|nr:epoxyqueuosine reductase QueH [Peptococcaceae bacterium]MBQ2015265.1 epoxyqueuosine reductase QueH [Peptococcaceae bacterium]MBQ2120161.1 epoxyqueuosine reductase QueH [Peptococcaceae bacterium]
MNTLLHTCCAPCSIHCVDTLRQEGIEPVSYWFNPNIHPYTEYRSRKTTLEEYAKSINMRLVIDNTYGLRNFVKNVIDDLDHRCFYCYQVRLDETARYAAEHHFDSFTTTLLVSPYQKHEALIQAGETAAKKYGVPFLYRDFRPGFKDGQQKARELELYMQKYCGCIFSEEERYRMKQLLKEKERLRLAAEQTI